MNAYNPNKHHRKSIRLKGYDYAQAGMYFITICCYDRAHLFGKIEKGTMIINDAGKIVNKCWFEIPEHFPNVQLHEFVIMPNHIHGIIEIVGANKHSPANNINNHSPDNDLTNKMRAKDLSPLRSPSKTVGAIVRGFKIGVTKWIRQNTNVYDVWQRNYYDHIIRNEKSYQTISEYIINNPKKWKGDKFYTQ